MKIEKIIIKNVKSFKNNTEIYLNKNMNIFIGSNRGGKSNFLDIVIFILRHFFVSFYRVVPSRERGITIEDINEERIFHPINNFLEKYLGNDQNDSLVEVVFIISKEDVDNINVIKKTKKNLSKFLMTTEINHYLIFIYHRFSRSFNRHRNIRFLPKIHPNLSVIFVPSSHESD